MKRSPFFFLQRHARGSTSTSEVAAAPRVLELQQASAYHHQAQDGAGGADASGPCPAEPIVTSPASHGNDSGPGAQAVQDQAITPAPTLVDMEALNTWRAHVDSERSPTSCMVPAAAVQDESSPQALTLPVRGVVQRRRGRSPGGLGSPALQGLMQV